MAGYVYKGTDLDTEAASPERKRRQAPHGIPGLYIDKDKWRARVVYKGKPYELGRFTVKEDAVQAIQTKRAELQAADPDWLTVKPCGTHAAYKRHQRRGEPIDLDCRRAENEYLRTHRKDKAA